MSLKDLYMNTVYMTHWLFTRSHDARRQTLPSLKAWHKPIVLRHDKCATPYVYISLATVLCWVFPTLNTGANQRNPKALFRVYGTSTEIQGIEEPPLSEDICEKDSCRNNVFPSHISQSSLEGRLCFTSLDILASQVKRDPTGSWYYIKCNVNVTAITLISFTRIFNFIFLVIKVWQWLSLLIQKTRALISENAAGNCVNQGLSFFSSSMPIHVKTHL